MAETNASPNEFHQLHGTEYPSVATPKATPFDGLPPVLTPVPGAADTSPSNAAYETALNVLLSLGTGAGQVSGSAIATPRPREARESVGNYFEAFPTSNFGPPVATATPIAELTEQFSTCALLPQDKVVQLLRHYRYNIAPWVSHSEKLCRKDLVGADNDFQLDVGDPAQTFGLEVSRLAMTSNPLLESLLSLSCTSLDRRADPNMKELIQTQSEASEISLVESLIVIAFAGVKQFAASTPREWQSPFSNIGLGSLDAALSHREYFAVRMGVSWIMLRLGRFGRNRLGGAANCKQTSAWDF